MMAHPQVNVQDNFYVGYSDIRFEDRCIHGLMVKVADTVI